MHKQLISSLVQRILDSGTGDEDTAYEIASYCIETQRINIEDVILNFKTISVLDTNQKKTLIPSTIKKRRTTVYSEQIVTNEERAERLFTLQVHLSDKAIEEIANLLKRIVIDQFEVINYKLPTWPFLIPIKGIDDYPTCPVWEEGHKRRTIQYHQQRNDELADELEKLKQMVAEMTPNGSKKIHDKDFKTQVFEHSTGVGGFVPVSGMISKIYEPSKDKTKITECPKLGDNPIVPTNVMKSIQVMMGNKQMCFEPEKEGGISIRNGLKHVRDAILQANLDNDAAYKVLLQCTKGPLHTYIEGAWEITPFASLWDSIQPTTSGEDPEIHKREIDKILNGKGKGSTTSMLYEIVNHVRGMYNGMIDPTERSIMVMSESKRYIFMYIATFFPFAHGQIFQAFSDMEMQYENEKKAAALKNQSFNKVFDGITILVKITTNYLEKIGNVTPLNQQAKNIARIHQISGQEDKPDDPLAKISSMMETLTAKINAIESQGGGYNQRQPGSHQKKSYFGKKDEGNITCWLCNIKGHRWGNCRFYPGDKPGDKVCDRCLGRHTRVCTRPRPIIVGSQERPNANKNNHWKQKKEGNGDERRHDQRRSLIGNSGQQQPPVGMNGQLNQNQ